MGAIKIYQLKNDNWSQIGTDLIGGSLTFGTSISLSEDGTVISEGSGTVHKLTIDESTPITVSFAFSDESITEGSESDVNLVASLLYSSTIDVTIPYTLSGTADSSEYGVTESPIVITAGSLNGTATIKTKDFDDTDVEITETIIFNFSDITNASSSTTDITLNLIDNDKPSVALSFDSTSLSEAGGSTIITATQSDITSNETTIELAFSGSALLNTDYKISSTLEDLKETIFGNKYQGPYNGNRLFGSGSELNQLNSPVDVFIDSNDNIYVADSQNYRVIKFASGASKGVVVAGGNGQGSALNQISPGGVQVDSSGAVYVSDSQNYRVMKWTPDATEGIVVAGGNGSGSNLNQIQATSIFLDSSENLYVVDEMNGRVMKWEPGATEGTVVAGGNGNGSDLNQLDNPGDVFIDSNDNIYVSDMLNNRIVKWIPDATEGVVLAGGNGKGSELNQFN